MIDTRIRPERSDVDGPVGQDQVWQVVGDDNAAAHQGFAPVNGEANRPNAKGEGSQAKKREKYRGSSSESGDSEIDREYFVPGKGRRDSFSDGEAEQPGENSMLAFDDADDVLNRTTGFNHEEQQ